MEIPEVTSNDSEGGGGEDATAGEQQQQQQQQQQAGGNAGRIVIPRFITEEDEKFEFCFDQLFNGNYEQSRAALECFVEKDDQLSRHYTEVVNQKKAQHEANNQLERPSTSQSGPSQTEPKQECTQKELDNVVKYQHQLKKNPFKYQKVLQKARDFHKQRWEQMTEMEKNEYDKRILDAALKEYNKVSAEKKRIRSKKSYEYMKNDEAQMEKKRATRRRCYAKQKASGTDKFECTFPGCDKSFVDKGGLVKHEQTHNVIKPFSYTWANCRFFSKNRDYIIRHVRTQHFHLPITVNSSTARKHSR